MSGLSPSDARVAVRSFPRRFRALLARPDDDDRRDRTGEDQVDPDELARRIGPEGTSAVDHLLAADGVLAVVDRALQEAVGHEDPLLHPAVADLADVAFEDPHRPLGDLLDQLEGTAADFAERIDRVPRDEWGREIRVAGRDATVGLLELVQEAVDVVAGHLRSAQRTLEAVR